MIVPSKNEHSYRKNSSLSILTVLGIAFPRDLSVLWQLNSIAVRRSLSRAQSLSCLLRRSRVLWWSKGPGSVPNDADTEHRCDRFRHNEKSETNLSLHHSNEWNLSSVHPRRTRDGSKQRSLRGCRSYFVFDPFPIGLLSRWRSSLEHGSILFVIRVIIRATTSTATCARWQRNIHLHPRANLFRLTVEIACWQKICFNLNHKSRTKACVNTNERRKEGANMNANMIQWTRDEQDLFVRPSVFLLSSSRRRMLNKEFARSPGRARSRKQKQRNQGPSTNRIVKNGKSRREERREMHARTCEEERRIASSFRVRLPLLCAKQQGDDRWLVWSPPICRKIVSIDCWSPEISADFIRKICVEKKTRGEREEKLGFDGDHWKERDWHFCCRRHR